MTRLDTLIVEALRDAVLYRRSPWSLSFDPAWCRLEYFLDEDAGEWMSDLSVVNLRVFFLLVIAAIESEYE